FKCFQDALSKEQSFLADILQQRLDTIPVTINRHSSLTDIHETLLRGAVPDRPTYYTNRPQTIAKLTDGFRWLGSTFRPPSALCRQDGSLDNDGSLHPDIPTNAWFLIYGPPGQGKSVMTAAVLRQNRQLLKDMFSGGVVWLRVGERRNVEPTQQTIDVLSALIEHVDALSSTSSSPGNRSSLLRQSSTANYRGNNVIMSSRSSSVDDPFRGGSGGMESEINKMTSLLHKMLIAKQYRRSEVFDTHTISP
ncbi:unnamed protein product, partial [Hymenolepis diminuta]